VVGITSHLGNWEVLNHFYCSQCKPIIFYRPPKLKAVDDLLRKQRVQLGNRVAPSTKEGILSVIKEVRKGGQVGIPADPEPAESAGIFVPFFATQALTSKFVPNMLAGGKGGRRVPACPAPAGRFRLQSDPRSGARSHVQHRHRRVLRGDEQGGRALCARVPEPVHVEHEALQEAPAGRGALVLTPRQPKTAWRASA
jgi:lauroyl/myristoyl acyltransferase